MGRSCVVLSGICYLLSYSKQWLFTENLLCVRHSARHYIYQFSLHSCHRIFRGRECVIHSRIPNGAQCNAFHREVPY